MKLNLKRVEEPFVMELTNSSGNTCSIDANPSIGGKDKGFRPMELLAGSLAACASIDVLNILKKQRIDLKHYKVEINAHRKDAIPSPFELIHLIFELDEVVDEEKMKRNIELTLEKYCSVSASLKSEIKISYEIRLLKS
jgi:putative redox protein